MWLLRNDSKGLLYWVTAGKQHVVTRKEGDLLLVGDQSISRLHASLFVREDNADGGIVLKDSKSKYGTFAIIGNGELTQLQPEEEVVLKNGDCVRFGVLWNSWRVEFVPLLVATSTLSQDEKKAVKELVAKLGGQVASDWQPTCTHLTMNKLTVTVKVVCALAAGQPIVTPAYWSAFSQALTTMQTTLPDVTAFLPPLAEAVLNPSEVSFNPEPARKSLFAGLTFITASAKQLTRIRPMVTAAGGTAEVFSANSWRESDLLDNKTILMQHSANDRQGSQQSQLCDGYLPLARKLREKGIRCIPESEIGLSVVHCSLSKYCNPRYSVHKLLGSSNSLQNTQPVTIISADSQDSSNPTAPIPSTSHTRDNEEFVATEPQPIQKRPHDKSTEDLFNSQNSENVKSNKSNSSGKKSLSLSRRYSLENITNSESVKKKCDPITSFDPFAPSGSRTSQAQDQDEIRPSCEDMFGSGNKLSLAQSNKLDNNKPSTSKAGQLPLENNEDDFSFTSSKRTRKALESVVEEDDFSFVQSKKPKIAQEKNVNNESSAVSKRVRKPPQRFEDEDVFAFTPSKKSKVVKEQETGKDEFSFENNKSSKRMRQSDPDMFADTIPSISSNHQPQKIRKVNEKDDDFEFGNEPQVEPNEEIFSFSKTTKPKNKKTHPALEEEEILIPLVKTEKETTSTNNKTKHRNEEAVMDQDNLPVYSKSIIKKELKEEDMDELSRELQNATIVMVKPLVVQKPKPVEVRQDAGVNFKKFRKVTVSKRIVPLIIGGSDLIPHVRSNGNIDLDDDLRPVLAPVVDEDDSWAFGNTNKKKTTIRRR